MRSACLGLRRDHLAGEGLDALAKRLVLVAQPVVHPPIFAWSQKELGRATRTLGRVVRARVQHLYTTFEHLIHEIAKFGVVGAVAFVVTTALQQPVPLQRWTSAR